MFLQLTQNLGGVFAFWPNKNKIKVLDRPQPYIIGLGHLLFDDSWEIGLGSETQQRGPVQPKAPEIGPSSLARPSLSSQNLSLSLSLSPLLSRERKSLMDSSVPRFPVTYKSLSLDIKVKRFQLLLFHWISLSNLTEIKPCCSSPVWFNASV